MLRRLNKGLCVCVCVRVLNLGYMFHIALGFFLFLYKLPKSFFKQSCQLCLFQSLIYKEPEDESKYQVGKL